MSKEIQPRKQQGMETVRSADGTEIAFHRSGSGSPIVMVHGTVSDHRVWNAMEIQSPLEEQFTVYAMDRRGHGESGNGDPHVGCATAPEEFLDLIIEFAQRPN
ncbi:alpha/beta fold hydrolase [Haloferax profundi]|uniref:alpha/beta fold hydrolase n=1 Tax=Haloferax profundi TaxID=1544718 RepID=UPI0012F9331D|nr:alpha/beta fold hydrolase [Haloferax profundi]